MNLASKFLNPQKAQMVDRAYDIATQITSVARNPQEALQKAGISKEEISKAVTLLDNPLAGTVLSVLGTQKEDVLKYLKTAENSLENNNSFAEQAPASELEALQKTLAMLNK